MKISVLLPIINSYELAGAFIILNRTIFLLFPFVLTGITFIALPYLQRLPSAYVPLITLLPYLATVTGLFLAWRFNRSRIFFLLLIIFALYLCLSLRPKAELVTAHWLIMLVSLLLPLNFLLFSFFKERGIFTSHGTLRLAFLNVQGLIVWWLVAQGNAQWLAWLDTSWLKYHWAIKMEELMPQSAWLIFAVAVAWQIKRLAIKPTLLECGILTALLLAVLSITPNVSTTGVALLFGLSALSLIITLVQESYGMAYLDELTGLPGRRAMTDTLMSLGSRYAIAMLDVDHFKKFNDTHGHDVGDQVLRMVAKQIKKVEGGGQPARYGGEEFAIIFPNKGVSDVFAHLEVVRQRIADTPFAIRGKDRPKKAPDKPVKKPRKPKTVNVTISIGVAERTDKAPVPDEVMKAADKALYRAKEKGRNQVCK